MNWQQQQQQDESVRIEEAERILRAAEYRALTLEERRFLAVEVGIGDIYKETK